MMLHNCHPAYPSPLQIEAESRAECRNERDIGRLAACADLIANTMDALIPLLGKLENPRARWRPDDLMEALEENALDIKAEQLLLTGPVMIDEE